MSLTMAPSVSHHVCLRLAISAGLLPVAHRDRGAADLKTAQQVLASAQ
jgi:hypothetical protein